MRPPRHLWGHLRSPSLLYEIIATLTLSIKIFSFSAYRFSSVSLAMSLIGLLTILQDRSIMETHQSSRSLYTSPLRLHCPRALFSAPIFSLHCRPVVRAMCRRHCVGGAPVNFGQQRHVADSKKSAAAAGRRFYITFSDFHLSTRLSPHLRISVLRPGTWSYRQTGCCRLDLIWCQ